MYSADIRKPDFRSVSLWSIALLAVLSSMAYAQAVESQSTSPIGNKEPGKAETAAGDLIADAMRAKLGSNLAFVAASELKPKNEPFAAGTVTADNITGLLSYTDESLAMLILRGSVLKQALEKSVSMYPQSNMSFLQVSGLQFTFDPSKKAGERVTSVKIGSTPLSDEFFYTVTVTNSLANGALGYWKIWAKDDIKQRFPDMTAKQAVEDYLRANPRINYAGLGRITVK